VRVHLLRTFFSRWIKSLRRWVTNIWLYPGPCCPDRSLSKELSLVEINTWIHKVLDHGANLNIRASLAPLKEGVANTRVSLLGLVSMAYGILSFHHVHGLAQGLGAAHSEPWGANLCEDAARQEANCALN
jgi:hypothetical protein